MAWRELRPSGAVEAPARAGEEPDLRVRITNWPLVRHAARVRAGRRACSSRTDSQVAARARPVRDDPHHAFVGLRSYERLADQRCGVPAPAGRDAVTLQLCAEGHSVHERQCRAPAALLFEASLGNPTGVTIDRESPSEFGHLALRFVTPPGFPSGAFFDPRRRGFSSGTMPMFGLSQRQGSLAVGVRRALPLPVRCACRCPASSTRSLLLLMPQGLRILFRAATRG